jgi:tetratricopeptide (TPR) repeat protein
MLTKCSTLGWLASHAALFRAGSLLPPDRAIVTPDCPGCESLPRSVHRFTLTAAPRGPYAYIVKEVLRLPVLFLSLTVIRPLLACSVPQAPADTQPPQSIAALLDAGHYRRAFAALNATPLPTDASAHDIAQHDYTESRIAQGLGHFELAYQLADKAALSEPQNAAFHVQVAAAAGRLAQHAGLLKQLTYARRARKELDDAIALEPKRPDAVYGMMMFYEYAPSLIGGDKAAAKKLAEDLTTLDPARGYLAQATLAENRKDSASQADLLKKAVAADPDSYAAHVALSKFLTRSDPVDTDAADEQACLALLSDPSRVEAWQSLAELAVTAECWAEIDGLVQTAERFNPDDASAAYAAAVAMIAAGKNLDMAQALLTHYLEKLPEGDAPTTGRAHYQLALLSEKRGQKQDALFHLHAALEEDPTMEDARKDLKRMEHSN